MRESLRTRTFDRTSNWTTLAITMLNALSLQWIHLLNTQPTHRRSACLLEKESRFILAVNTPVEHATHTGVQHVCWRRRVALSLQWIHLLNTQHTHTGVQHVCWRRRVASSLQWKHLLYTQHTHRRSACSLEKESRLCGICSAVLDRPPLPSSSWTRYWLCVLDGWLMDRIYFSKTQQLPLLSFFLDEALTLWVLVGWLIDLRSWVKQMTSGSAIIII